MAAAEQRRREETRRQTKAAAQRQEEEAQRQEEAARTQREAERQRREEARQQAETVQKRPQPGEVFRDCPTCPEMVVVPAGTFRMGSPSYEGGRYDAEGPVHHVTIEQPFAVGVYEVTVEEYGRFVRATGYKAGNSCRTRDKGEWEDRSGRNWREPGFKQTEQNPVVCVNWRDARVYAEWLSDETGQGYRLLSEAEWEYAARAGTRTARYWGNDKTQQCRHANGADQTRSGTRGVGPSPPAMMVTIGQRRWGVMRRTGLASTICWGTRGMGARLLQ